MKIGTADHRLARPQRICRESEAEARDQERHGAEQQRGHVVDRYPAGATGPAPSRSRRRGRRSPIRPISRWSEVAAKGSPSWTQWRISKNTRKAANAIDRLSTKPNHAVAAAPLEQPAREEERHRRDAVAPQEPIEDRRPAGLAADDSRVVDEPREHEDADGPDGIA